MMHGNPLCGKSTTANLIKKHFEKKDQKYSIVKSVEMRYGGKRVKFTKECVDETIEKTKNEKDKCYKEVCRKAEEEILKGNNVIIDATFHKLYRRRWVYELVKEFNANFIILWFSFNNEDEIREFLKQRRDNPDFRDRILHTWDQYSIMVKQTDKLENFEFKNKIIYFDRDTKKIKLYNCDTNDELARELCHTIRTNVLK